ncbi:DUF5060 domain-containing protein [Paenibacillus aurantius]|uniref:DUF5060 domain-containing protein n=1 Tax=Paenibacillus aurantius TaxID=2918900 RepID=A0AA96L8Y9_9BACL|nr:DUF5060 domain-containing protein [Paenibacillus aurantius]WNQ08943.1 DUF5060 domain-containing protein [Paenibacillus aurantius]
MTKLGSIEQVERWDIFELTLDGPSDGNPYEEVFLAARFQYRNDKMEIEGFYDGEGSYRIRFMPDREGIWRYETISNVPELNGITGQWECTTPQPGNHGPVKVHNGYYFAYEDGTRYMPFGTTCYHWTHTGDEGHEEMTLKELAQSPFNKMRMCLLPTRDMRPPMVAFSGTSPEDADTSRFNPAFFQHLEKRILDLRNLGVEADLILFHPYDKQGGWGFNSLTREQDFHFLRYVIARLAAFRNVWWSLSNEYDFNKAKTVEDWDRLLQYVQKKDPYQRLRSIHNGTKMYERSSLFDFGKSWLTHQSIQHWDAELTTAWREAVRKPITIDEISYEGNISRRWGNITGLELVSRYWEGFTRGGFVAHGESFENTPTRAWISSGGKLYGESPERIRFLRTIMEEGPEDWIQKRREGEYALIYLGKYRPSYYELDLKPDRHYRVELIDIWEMSIQPLEGTFTGTSRIDLPSKPYKALRVQAV